jgi:hypothetical protein
MIQGYVLRTGVDKFETYENFGLFQTYRTFWILKLGLPNPLSFKVFFITFANMGVNYHIIM